jgi:hypothetical protein
MEGELLITLVIRNKTFVVPKNVLCQADYFKNLFEDTAVGDTITLNRSPKIFKHVLEALYDGKYPFPQKYEYELDFYLVNKKLVNIYDPHIKKLNRIQRNLNANIDSIDKLNNVCNLNNQQIWEVINIIKSDLRPCAKCVTVFKVGTPCCYDKTRQEASCCLHRICRMANCQRECCFGDLYCSIHK